MKVIKVDNYNREGPGYDDKLVAENLTTKEAMELAKERNSDPTRPDFDWFKVVEDDYKLYEWAP